MSRTESLLEKGGQLNERIAFLSASFDSQGIHQEKLVLSFDQFCLLVEYVLHSEQWGMGTGEVIHDLMNEEAIYFNTGKHELRVVVDFFAPFGTVSIA